MSILNKNIKAGILATLLMAPSIVAQAAEEEQLNSSNEQQLNAVQEENETHTLYSADALTGAKVTEQIANIANEPDALNKKNAIDFARRSYDALAKEEQVKVTNLYELTRWETAMETAKALDNKIAGFTVDSNLERTLLGLIDERDQLNDFAVALLERNEEISEYKSSAEAIRSFGKLDLKADNYKEQLATTRTAIEEAKKATITNAAKKVYLDRLLQEYIDKLDVKDADVKAAEEVTVLIDAVAGTAPEQRLEVLDNASTKYKALSADGKALTKNATQLSDLEKTYAPALRVVEMIKKLDPTNDKTYGRDLINVEKAYQALTPDVKALVFNYDSIKADLSVQVIIDEINKLRPTVKTFREDVIAIRATVEASADKAKITNIATLEGYEKNIKDADEFDARIVAAEKLPLKEQVAEVAAISAQYKSKDFDRDVKRLIQEGKKLTDLERQHKKVLQVIIAIDKLNPADKNYASRVKAAAKLYDKLSDEEKTAVTNYDTVKDIISEITVIEKLDKMRPANKTYRQDAKDMRALYDAMTAEQKAKIANIEKLEAAEAIIKAADDFDAKVIGLKDVAKNNLVEKVGELSIENKKLDRDVKRVSQQQKELAKYEKDNRVILRVITAIDQLDPNAKNYVTKFHSAKKMYDRLTDEQKLAVYNYDSRIAGALGAITTIEQIAKLKPTAKTFREDVKQTRKDLESLSTAERNKVTNIGVLALHEKHIKEADDFDNRIDGLSSKGDDIFVVEVAKLSNEYKVLDKDVKRLVQKNKILADYEKANRDVVKAIAAIDVLNPEDKNYVRQVQNAQKLYDKLNDKEKAKVANYAELRDVIDIANVMDKIAKIKVSSKTFEADVADARKAYEALPTAKKDKVTNYPTLVNYENQQTLAERIVKMIDNISKGDKDYLEQIVAARVAYNDLPTAQRKLITNYKKLTDYEKEVKPIIKVMTDIENLEAGAKGFETKVASARKGYDNLTPSEKKLVSNYDKLTHLEPAVNVVNLIKAIRAGNATFHDDVKKARVAYDALDEERKQMVTNYDALKIAETNINGAEGVVALIDALATNEPELYAQRVAEARTAYNALPTDQRKAVSNYNELVAQEKFIKPVADVIDKINRIFTSTNMASQYKAVVASYQKLTSEQREYVTNKQLFLTLEPVIEVYNKIEDLNPNVANYFGMIDAVRKSFNRLTQVDQGKVTNYNKLLKAEEDMAAVKRLDERILGLSPRANTYEQDVAALLEIYNREIPAAMKKHVIKSKDLLEADKNLKAAKVVAEMIAKLDDKADSFYDDLDKAEAAYNKLTKEQKALVKNAYILEGFLR